MQQNRGLGLDARGCPETALATSTVPGGKLRKIWVKPCSVICGAEAILIKNGIFAASAACATEMVLPESFVPIRSWQPSRISRSAAMRPFSGLDSASP
jgi:hypothetical protein